jgi:methionine-R-sulfoxide reductase
MKATWVFLAPVALAAYFGLAALQQQAAPETEPGVRMDPVMDVPIKSGPETYEVQKSEEEWRKTLNPEEYHVLREAGTERAFTGKYWDHKEQGVYVSKATGEVLFLSDTKFDSGCGWPSFFEAVPGRIEYRDDHTLGMHRIEVREASTGNHLGHVFPDGPQQTTGKRYCINSVAIEFKKVDELPAEEQELVKKLRSDLSQEYGEKLDKISH